MRHIRIIIFATCVLLLPTFMMAEDPEGGNPFNPWSKVGITTIKTTLKKIKEDPTAFKGQRVSFDCRYHKSEHRYQNYYTGLSETQYDGFSVWSMDSVLFKEESFAEDLPFMYVDKSGRAKTFLTKVNKFQVITVTGVVKSDYLNKPWIVAHEISTTYFSTKIEEKALIQARMGLSLIENKKYSAAAEELKSSLDQNFDTYLEAQVKKYCGYAYLKAGKAKNAVPYLYSAYNVIQDAESGSWWGQALVRSGDAAKAISELEDVISIHPTHLGLRASIAEAYSQKGNVSGCIRHARVMLNLNNGNKDAYLFMGKVLVDNQLYEDALKIYREAEQDADGAKGDYSWAMGKIYYHQKRYKHSFNEFENAKRTYPGNDSLALDTARSYREAGEKYHVKSARNFNRALGINDRILWPRLELAEMHFDDKEYKSTIVAVDGFLSKKKDHVPALIIKGLSHEKVGQFKTASKTFTALEKLDGVGYSSHHLGFNLLASGQYQASADAYARAATIDDLKKEFRFDAAFHAGSLYLMLGDHEKAEAFCELAHELNEGHLPSLINLCVALENNQKYKATFNHLSKLVQSSDLSSQQRVVVHKHWNLNALILGQTPDNNKSLDDSVSYVSKNKKNDSHVEITQAWVWAKLNDERCMAPANKYAQQSLLARIVKIEYLVNQSRLDEALKVAELDSLPKSSKAIVEIYRDLLDDLKDKVKARNKKIAAEEKQIRKEQREAEKNAEKLRKKLEE